MQMKYTEEKLNTFSKETLIQLFLTQQEQLSEIDGKLQLVLEQLAVMNQNRFGRKTEQMPVPEQLAFTDVDGEELYVGLPNGRERKKGSDPL